MLETVPQRCGRKERNRGQVCSQGFVARRTLLWAGGSAVFEDPSKRQHAAGGKAGRVKPDRGFFYVSSHAPQPPGSFGPGI